MSTKKKSRIHIDGDKLVLIAAIIVVFALFTCLNKNFLSVTNMINILIAASLVGMVAVGHTYLIIAGQNDLSPGSLAAFSGVVAALLVSKGMPFAAAVIASNSRLTFAAGCPEFIRAAKMMPPIEQRIPIIT